MNNYALNRPILFICCLFCLVTTTFAQSVSGIINSYYKVTGVNVVPNTVTVTSAAGLTPGQKILIIQMKGAVINSTNTSSFGNITSTGNAGNYEINYVCGVSGNNVLLQFSLLRSYDPAGSVQLITVPRYTSVTVSDTLKAAPWNPATGTGGVVVMQATDTIFLGAPIDVSGKGFTGGALLNNNNCVWSTDVTGYMMPATQADPNINSSKKGEGIADYIVNGDYGRGKQANGGGGGNSHNTGGAGGSNYGTGGNGGVRSNETFFACHGTSPGIGGLTLSSSGYTAPNNRIFMGGGGGAGHQNNSVGTPGGNGGGIIILLAKTIISGSGKLMANGGVPYNALCSNPYYAEGDGGGGGGAGGTIILNVQEVNSTLVTEVKGANGSVAGNSTNACTGPGGGGGGGVIWVSNAGVLGNISSVTNGGANGVISLVNSTPACQGVANGATSGGNGATLSGYSLPQASTFVCAPLASSILSSFEGKTNAASNQLSWSVKDAHDVSYYQLERSVNLAEFEAVARINNTGEKSMKFTDTKISAGITYYRLQLVYRNGGTEYSKVISLKRNSYNNFDWVALSPNPATDFLNIGIVGGQPGSLHMVILNQLGQALLNNSQFIKKGYSTIIMPLKSLAPGVYFVRVELNGNRQVRKFIVSNK